MPVCCSYHTAEGTTEVVYLHGIQDVETGVAIIILSQMCLPGFWLIGLANSGESRSSYRISAK